MKFDRIFLKFGKLTSNYITKLFTYARHNYEIFENFGAMLMPNPLMYLKNFLSNRFQKKLYLSTVQNLTKNMVSEEKFYFMIFIDNFK